MGKRLDEYLATWRTDRSGWNMARARVRNAADQDERELRELLRASVELVERRLRIVSAPVSPKCVELVALHEAESAFVRKAKAALG